MPFNVAFDPVSMISGIAQAQNAAAALQLQQQELAFQKEQAKKQYDLATGKRTDAFGNTVDWNPYTKEWETVLTPTQQGLVKAGEREQGLSLGEDAERNRNVKRRQATRAEGAEDDFNTSLMGYRYDQPDSEDASFSELARLMAGANEGRSKEVRDTLGRGALRLGRGADIEKLVKSSNDMLGQMLPDTILAARSQARGEHAQDQAQHDSQYIGEMGYFQGLEDDVGGSPQLFSNAPSTQANSQQAMLSAISNAIQSGSAGVGNAYNNLASTMMQQGYKGGGVSVSGSFGGGEQAKPGYMTVPPGNSIFDPSTGEVLYTAPVYGKASGGGGNVAPTTSASNYDDAMSALARLAASNGGSTY